MESCRDYMTDPNGAKIRRIWDAFRASRQGSQRLARLRRVRARSDHPRLSDAPLSTPEGSRNLFPRWLVPEDASANPAGVGAIFAFPPGVVAPLDSRLMSLIPSRMKKRPPPALT